MLLNRFIYVDGIQLRNIKSGQPHIDNDSDFEIGFRIFELPVKFLAVILCSKHFIEGRLIIFVASHHQLDLLNRLQFFFLFIGKRCFIFADFLFRPLGTHLYNDFVKIISDIAVHADKHCLSRNRSALCHTGFVMVNKVLGDCMQPVRIADNCFHLGDSFLAFLNLMFVSALCLALIVILFDFFDFYIVQRHPCRTPVVNKIDGNAVTHRFGHGVGIHHRAENFDRPIHRRSGKADIGSIRQGIMQILGKAVFAFHTRFGHFDLLVEVDLASVRLIRNTNDIGSVGEQLQILREFLDGR